MYKNLEQALLDLERAGMLKRIQREVDPYLEMPEIARQAFENHGPAILFEHVKGSPFRAVCNIFGTQERLDFLFRDTLKGTQTAVVFKSNPVEFFKHASPAKLLRAARTGLHSLPKRAEAFAILRNASSRTCRSSFAGQRTAVHLLRFRRWRLAPPKTPRS